MKIKVDRERCFGHAMCVARAPQVYKIDDDGYCISDGEHVPEKLEQQARRGADACPEGCITLVTDR
jgi:ferredoxin